MHVKLEESNSLVKTVKEIDSFGEDIKKVSLKNSSVPDEKLRDDANGEVQEVEVESTQPLPKVWNYNASHSKDLIISDVSKGVTIRSKLHDICDHFAFISHIEPKNILEVERDSYLLLTMQEELNQFERNQV